MAKRTYDSTPTTTSATTSASAADDTALARRLEILQQIPLLAHMSSNDLRQMVDDLRQRTFSRNDTIFRQGDESRELYIVLKGIVRIFKISPGGGETTIELFSTHDVFGELAAIDNLPRSATAQCVDNVSLLVISQQQFDHHTRTRPGLAYGLAHVLSQKLRWTSAFAESIAQFDAAGRLLHFLILYTQRYGKPIREGIAYELELGLSQSDLASMVGARREWVNRIMGDWRRRGLVDYDREVIQILDMPAVIAERDSRTEANLGGGDW
ncbi:MAG: Crp/Fnr family transcriptional regulator [Litorilinea sp.]